GRAELRVEGRRGKGPVAGEPKKIFTSSTALPHTIEPRPPRFVPTGTPPTLMRYNKAPLLSGSRPNTSPPLVPAMRTRFPFERVFKTGELPISMSGPIGSGHASLFTGPLHPPMNTSFSVA